MSGNARSFQKKANIVFRGCVSKGMRNSTMLGSISIAIGCSLFAVLAYEPANIVQALGLNGRVSEAGVVIGTLLVSAICGLLGGKAMLAKASS